MGTAALAGEDARSTGETDQGDVYRRVRDMAISFRFPPGQRINEGELARQLNVSRTPVREAMQKLVSENLLVWKRSLGFFCRSLDAREIVELYQLRQAIEGLAVRLACERASDEELTELDRSLDALEALDHGQETFLGGQLSFHERIAELSGNREILRALENINARIHFVRWIAMGPRWHRSDDEHRQIVAAMRARDPEKAARIIVTHLDKRPEEIQALVREGYARIYTAEFPPVAEGNKP